MLCFSDLADNVSQSLEEISHDESSNLSVAGGILLGFGGLAMACVCGICLRCLQRSFKKSSPNLSTSNKTSLSSPNLIDFENNNNSGDSSGLKKGVVQDQKPLELAEFDPFSGSKPLDDGQESNED